jgi:2-oxoglutarate ferredoxin oxidoreductase subunit alpha
VPFTDEIETFIRDHDRVYVVEMNHLGQMRRLLQLHVADEAAKIQALTKNDGLPLSARWITDALLEAEGG